MSAELWDERLRILQAVYGRFVDDVVYDKMPAATEEELDAMEEELGQPLPESLRLAFLRFSKGLRFEADFSHMASELPMAAELKRAVFRARLAFSPQGVLEAERERQDLAENVFTLKTAYDRLSQNKLGLMLVQNGDVIAADLEEEAEDPPVVYLSHDEGPGHGYRLGDNFGDFIDRVIELGAVGPEDVQLMPFLADEESGLDSEGENAFLYRNAIGLDWA